MKQMLKNKNTTIGIITFHSANNYGAVLQCYALSKVLISWGYEVKVVDLPLHNKPKPIRSSIRQWMVSLGFFKFRKHRLPVNIEKSEECDLYIFGSDQIWNIDITKENYKLYFGNWIKNYPKIAYAASFGVSKWKHTTYDKEIKKLLLEFSSIGVRENSGAKICKEIFGINSYQVVDPTILLTNYKNIFKQIKQSKSLICYIFEKENKINAIKSIGNKIGFKTVILNDFRKRKGIKSVPFPSVSKWLSYINSGGLILTDSFHCMVFAILFNKNFIAIPAKLDRIDRMLSLLKELGLESRFFYNTDEIVNSKVLDENIDYEKVNDRLDSLREDSLNFLKVSLNEVVND
jgi:hypothetical protein